MDANPPQTARDRLTRLARCGLGHRHYAGRGGLDRGIDSPYYERNNGTPGNVRPADLHSR